MCFAHQKCEEISLTVVACLHPLLHERAERCVASAETAHDHRVGVVRGQRDRSRVDAGSNLGATVLVAIEGAEVCRAVACAVVAFRGCPVVVNDAQVQVVTTEL